LRSEVTALSEPLVGIRNNHSDRYSHDRLAAFCAWVRLYGKLAALMPNERLRSICRRRRGERALVLAGQYVDRGKSAEVLRTVLESSTYAWRYPEWWWRALKTIIKPLVPNRVRSDIQRLRSARRS
jgi:hypothetical protein